MERLLKSSNTTSSRGGFTIVEVLVAVAISGVVMGGIYSAYYSQQKSYEVQEKVVAVQQNLRAAMYFLEREIRMAGLDPQDIGTLGIIPPSTADTTATTSSSLRFSEDVSDPDDVDGDDELNEPSGTKENSEDIKYEIIDQNLMRTTGKDTADVTAQTIANNIEYLGFVYLDSDGTVIPTITAANVGSIRSVQVSIIGRSERQDPAYTSNDKFKNLQGTTIGTYSDHYRREMLTAQVKCRNIGLGEVE